MSGAADEPARHSEFGRCEAEGFLSKGFWHTGNFKKHVARTNNRDPEFRGAFTFTHPGFRGAGGHWLMWEDTNEDLAFTFEIAGNRNPAGLNLIVLDPSAAKNLKAIFAKGDGSPGLGIAGTAATVGLAVFNSTGKHRHNLSDWLEIEFKGERKIVKQ